MSEFRAADNTPANLKQDIIWVLPPIDGEYRFILDHFFDDLGPMVKKSILFHVNPQKRSRGKPLTLFS